ncbi:MAG: SMI1/KNR4 family protein [Actinomycetota bacterium]
MIFADSAFYTGPHLTPEMIRSAEQQLGVALPSSYLELLVERNGGRLSRSCINVDFWTPTAPGAVEIRAILGIGGEWGVDGPNGSQMMVDIWRYPVDGVVICAMESGGHDAVMLNYADENKNQEPTVVHVDEELTVRPLAATFSDFLDVLVVPNEARFREQP